MSNNNDNNDSGIKHAANLTEALKESNHFDITIGSFYGKACAVAGLDPLKGTRPEGFEVIHITDHQKFDPSKGPRLAAVSLGGGNGVILLGEIIPDKDKPIPMEGDEALVQSWVSIAYDGDLTVCDSLYITAFQLSPSVGMSAALIILKAISADEGRSPAERQRNAAIRHGYETICDNLKDSEEATGLKLVEEFGSTPKIVTP